MMQAQHQIIDPICRQWHTKTRYYSITIEYDIFGYWVITRNWRGRFSKNGQRKVTSTLCYEEAMQCLKNVSKQREKRHYVLLDGGNNNAV